MTVVKRRRSFSEDILTTNGESWRLQKLVTSCYIQDPSIHPDHAVVIGMVYNAMVEDGGRWEGQSPKANRQYPPVVEFRMGLKVDHILCARKKKPPAMCLQDWCAMQNSCCRMTHEMNCAATSKKFKADISICRCSQSSYTIPTRDDTVHQIVNGVFSLVVCSP